MMDLDPSAPRGVTFSRRCFLGAGVSLAGLVMMPSLGAAAQGKDVALGGGVTQLRVRLGKVWLSPEVDYRVRGGQLSLAPNLLRGSEDELGLFYQDKVGSWHERRIRLGA